MPRKKTDLPPDDVTMIQRCAASPVRYTYAPCPKGGKGVVLAAWDIPEKWRKTLDALARRGLVAKSVTGCEGRRDPPETVLTYTATALGRDAIGLHAALKPMRNVVRLKSSAMMLEEANAHD